MKFAASRLVKQYFYPRTNSQFLIPRKWLPYDLRRLEKITFPLALRLETELKPQRRFKPLFSFLLHRYCVHCSN